METQQDAGETGGRTASGRLAASLPHYCYYISRPLSHHRSASRAKTRRRGIITDVIDWSIFVQDGFWIRSRSIGIKSSFASFPSSLALLAAVAEVKGICVETMKERICREELSWRRPKNSEQQDGVSRDSKKLILLRLKEKLVTANELSKTYFNDFR